jgi:hypothetical protein
MAAIPQVNPKDSARNGTRDFVFIRSPRVFGWAGRARWVVASRRADNVERGRTGDSNVDDAGAKWHRHVGEYGPVHMVSTLALFERRGRSPISSSIRG